MSDELDLGVIDPGESPARRLSMPFRHPWSPSELDRWEDKEVAKRRSDWRGVVAMTRSSPNVWRLHPSLAASTKDFRRHARRRVPLLQPSDAGHYEFQTRNEARDDLGRLVRDLWVRFVPTERSE